MQETRKTPVKRRTAVRHPADAAVACRPFSSRGGARGADAVMRNFSRAGVYIESVHEFKIGTILQLRILKYPTTLQSFDPDDRPRSMGLAAVKWRQQLTAEDAGPYGYGLKYLD